MDDRVRPVVRGRWKTEKPHGTLSFSASWGLGYWKEKGIGTLAD
jgi:hypothetical protein